MMKWNVGLLFENNRMEIVKVSANTANMAIQTATASWRYWNGYPMKLPGGRLFNKPDLTTSFEVIEVQPIY